MTTDDIVTRLRQEWEYGNNAKGCDYEMFSQAADEIERLRKIIHDFYFEEEKYQDAMNSNSVEQYIIPQSWKDAYTAFQNEARKIEFGDD